MLCVLILYICGRTYSLKSTPKDRFFEKLFMAIYIYSQRFCQKSAERKSPKNTFVFMSGLRLNPGFSSNKPTHYLLNPGDFIWCIKLLKELSSSKLKRVENIEYFCSLLTHQLTNSCSNFFASMFHHLHAYNHQNLTEKMVLGWSYVMKTPSVLN